MSDFEMRLRKYAEMLNISIEGYLENIKIEEDVEELKVDCLVSDGENCIVLEKGL